jgi:hypothetical protein
MEGKVLFKTKGMKDDAAGGFAMAGIFCFLVPGILTFAFDGMIGEWYFYAIGAAVCTLIVTNSANKHSIAVTLKEANSNDVIMSIKGKANNTEFILEEYSCWYVVKFRRAKHGGKEVKLHFRGVGKRKDPVCFTQVIHPPVEPKGWSRDATEFPMSYNVYMIDDLTGLAKALDDHEKRSNQN